MWTGSFDPRQRTIWVDVRITGPVERRHFTFVLDTGSPWTIVDPGVLDELGYGAHMGTTLHRAWAIGGAARGYRIPIQRLEVMGFAVESCVVAAEDLPRDLGVDGLIGMDLIEGHVLHIDAVRGQLAVDP